MSQVESYSRLAAVYDEMVVDDAYPQWAAFLHGLWQHDEARVTSVLDVCCGTGLMAAELTHLGYGVVGIDSSTEMLDRARELLGPEASLARVVLPALPAIEVFDAAISTFDGLNYLTPDDFALTIRGLADRVRPGGWLCFDLHSDTMMQFAIDNPHVSGEADGKAYEIHTEVDRESRSCATTITITEVSDGGSFTEVHRQYFHPGSTVAAVLAEEGFGAVAVMDEYTSVPATSDTMRDTWVARRT